MKLRTRVRENQSDAAAQTHPLESVALLKLRAASLIVSAETARMHASCFAAPALVAAESVQFTALANASLRGYTHPIQCKPEMRLEREILTVRSATFQFPER